jgi:hypothetical protein
MTAAPVLGLISLAAVGALGLGRLEQRPEPRDLTGHEWTALEPAARQAWLQGFLTGAATSQALAAGAADSAALHAAMLRLRREGSLEFLFAPNVYSARVADFYHYEDRRPLPVWYAMWVVNRQLKSSEQ